MKKSKKYSQNFFNNSRLIEKLITWANITPADTVIEIGSGEGKITHELVKKARKVIAYEIDKNLFDRLRVNQSSSDNLDLKLGNFLDFPLPNYSYKVFSNIPFNTTSEIIKKLTFNKNPPVDSYLVVQKESAARFLGLPLDTKNSEISVLLYPWFEFLVVYKFQTSDFTPKPKVDIVFLRIRKRKEPLVDNNLRDKYTDFVSYIFGRQKQDIIRLTDKPSSLSFKSWIKAFNTAMKNQGKIKASFGFFERQLKEQEKIMKIKRTRLDRNWKQYK